MHPFHTAGWYGISCGGQGWSAAAIPSAGDAATQLAPEQQLKDEKTGPSLFHRSGLSREFVPDIRLFGPEDTSGLEQTA